MEKFTSPSWDEMNTEIMEQVFAKLPEKSVLRASSACKGWNSVVSDSNFVEVYQREQRIVNTESPYHFKLEGKKFSLKRQDGAFSVQLAEIDENCCFDLPTFPSPSTEDDRRIPCLKGGGGILYVLADEDEGTQVMHYKFSVLQQEWISTSPLLYRMHDPLPIVGFVKDGENGKQTIVCAGQIDSRDGGLVVQIYDCTTRSWTVGEVLPYEFRDSPHSFTTSVVHGQRIFAYDNFMGFVSELDIYTKQWSKVKMVWLSSKVQRSCLFSLPEGLCLAAIEDGNESELRCNVWSIDNVTLQRNELLHSQLIRHSRPAPLTGIFRHRLSACLDVLSMTIFLFLLVLVQLVIFGHAIAVRCSHRIQASLNSGILTCLRSTSN